MHNEELQQKLWEFVYELLPDDEAQALKDQITSDPQIARAYAEVKLQSEVLAEAVRVPAEVVPLHKPAADKGPIILKPASHISKPEKVSPRSRTLGNWISTVAATILVCALGISFAVPAWINHQARQFLTASNRLMAIAPQKIDSQADNPITIQTNDKDGSPTSETVHLSVEDSLQKTIYRQTAQTNANGIAQISVPAKALRDSNSDKYFLVMYSESSSEPVRGQVQLGRENILTHLETAGDRHEPTEPVYYGVRAVDRANGDGLEGISIHTQLVTPDYKRVLAEATQTTDKHGVVSGKLAYTDTAVAEDAAVPEADRLVVRAKVASDESPAQEKTVELRRAVKNENVQQLALEFGKHLFKTGEYLMADVKVANQAGEPIPNATVNAEVLTNGELTSKLGEFNTNADGQTKIIAEVPAAANMTLQVNSLIDGVPTTLTAPVPVETAEAKLQFFPEGGNLVAGVVNHVYFQALTTEDKPLEINGRLLDDQGNTITIYTDHKLNVGRGEFDLTPTANGVYHVQLDEPAGWSASGELPTPESTYFAAMHAERSVLEPNESLHLKVASTVAERQMVIVATSRGVEVGHLAVDVFGNAEPVDAVIPLSDNAEGTIRVTLFDYSTTPPRTIAERLVYREPKQRLQVTADSTGNWLAGGLGELELQVKDASGKPVDANIDVGLWCVGAGESKWGYQPGLPADFWLLSEINQPSSWDEVNAYVDGSDRAEEQLNLLLGVQRSHAFEDSTLPLYANASGFAYDRGSERSENAGAQASILPPQLLSNREAMIAREAQANDLHDLADKWIENGGKFVILLAIVSLIAAMVLASRQWANAKYWGTTLAFSATVLLAVGLYLREDLMPKSPAVRGVAENTKTDSQNTNAFSSDHEARTEAIEAPMARMAQRDSRVADEVEPPLAEEAIAPADAPPPSAAMRNDAPDAPAADATTATPAAPPTAALPEGPLPPAPAPAGAGGGGFGTAAPRSRSVQEKFGGGLGGGGRGDNFSDGSMRGGLEADKSAAEPQARKIEQPDVHLQLEQQKSFGLGSNQPRFAVPGADAASTLSRRALLWERSKNVNSEGKVTFEVQLPEQPIHWRMLVTAQSPQGIGELRKEGLTRDPSSFAENAPARMSLSDRVDPPVEIFSERSGLESATDDQARLAIAGALPGQQQQLIESYAYHPANDFSQQGLGYKLWFEKAGYWKRVPVTADRYPMVKNYTGKLRETENLQIDLPNYQTGTPVQVTLRIYPSLTAEILDAARACASIQPILYDNTFAALQKAQSWMNGNRVADVEAMRGMNNVLALNEWPAFKGSQELFFFRALADQNPDAGVNERAKLSERNRFRRTDRELTTLKTTPADRLEELDVYRKALAASSPKALEDLGTDSALDELARLQADDGHLPPSTTNKEAISNSEQVEVTALGVLAWSQQAPKYQQNIEKSLDWLRSQRTGDGGWVTEQATGLALMALCTSTPQSATNGYQIQISNGDKTEPLTAAAGTDQPLIWRGPVTPDQNGHVALSLMGPVDHAVPYAMRVDYAATEPVLNERAPLKVSNNLSEASVHEQDQVQLNVTIEGQAEPIIAVRISIPAGLQLADTPIDTPHGWKEGDLVLYFESPFVAPQGWVKQPDRLELSLPLIARHAGHFTAPAVRAFPANAPELMSWGQPMEVEVHRTEPQQ